MKHLILTASIFAVGLASAQDITGFLPMNNLLDINPSFAGSNGGFRLQANYVNIWPSLSGRNQGTTLAADMSVNKGRSGIAIYANRADYAHGVLLNSNLGLGYAHRFSVSNGNIKIVPSVQMGVVNAKVDVNALSFGSALTPVDPNIMSKSNLEVNTGVLVQIKEKFSIGYGAFHVNTPDVGLAGPSKLGARSVVHASYNFIKDNNSVINLFGAYTYQYGFDNVTVACSAILKKHYYVVLSGKHQTFYDEGTLGIGWRSDLWSAMFAYNAGFSRGYTSYFGSYQLGCSFSMRGIKHIHGLSALENW